MGEKTKIEWCDSTCNLMMGCDGCELYPDHCYAAKLTSRYAGRNRGWPKEFSKPELFLDRLDETLRWRDKTGLERPEKPWLNGMPRLVFLNDLGDCFTESFQDLQWLSNAVEKMIFSRHVFLLLTKRPQRMADFVDCWCMNHCQEFPKNVWCGASVTDQATADLRIPHLLRCHVAVRFLSCEPLLSWVKINSNWLPTQMTPPIFSKRLSGFHDRPGGGIHWIIAGGESGAKARPTHPDAFRSLRDLCQAAHLPFFFKGYGEWSMGNGPGTSSLWMTKDGRISQNPARDFNDGSTFVNLSRVGKNASGRLLDGREWNEMPEVA
jgi:protein gp37